jgi:ATP-dependent DNA ligase
VVFAKACELGLEGIVSKRAGSLNKSGPSRNWLKTKNPDFVRT